jgi:hypothetical protein
MRVSQLLLALLALAGTLQFASAQETGEAPPALVNPNPLSSLNLESLTATRSLLFFTPSRTAPMVDAPVEEEVIAASVEPQVEPDAPPPDLQLIGIVLADSSQTALLRNQSTGEVLRLTSGDEFEEWAVKIVDAVSVELRRGDRVQGLKMFETFPAPPFAGNSMGQPGEMLDPDGNPIPADVYPEEDMSGAFNPEAPPPDAPPATEFLPELGDAPIPEEGALAPAVRQTPE